MNTPIVCPHCHGTLTVFVQAVTQVVSCPYCRGQLSIPPHPVHVPNPRPQPDDPFSGMAERPLRKRQNASPAIAALAIGLVAVIIASVAGVVWYSSREKARNAPVVVQLDQPIEPQKKVAQTVPVLNKPKAEAGKGKSELWKVQAGDELLEVLKVRQAEESAHARSVGSLNEAEKQEAFAAAKFVSKQGFNSPDHVLQKARVIIPNYVDGIVREKTMRMFGENVQLGDVDENGKFRPRYPLEKRKELYAVFAKEAGIDLEWSFARHFEELNAEDMDKTIFAVQLANKEGLGTLTTAQRFLIMRAGGTDFVAKCLGIDLKQP